MLVIIYLREGSILGAIRLLMAYECSLLTHGHFQVLRTQALRTLRPAHVIAILIMTEGKLGVKQLVQGCTCARAMEVFSAEDHG